MKKNKKINIHKKIEQINVYIWDKFVGACALDPKIGFYVFSYDPKFARSGINLSPIHMPLRDTQEPYVFSDLPEATYKRLPALLADALPDDFGNALIDSYMAQKGIFKGQITPLDRLAYMGKRAMGALEFRPANGPRAQKATAIELGDLVEQARKSIRGDIVNDDHANAALRSIIEVGTSAGGARAKAVISWNASTDEIRSGQVDAPEGFEHWLLKFDGIGLDRELGVSQDYGRIEFAYYLMAKQAGIQISESRLFDENGRSHFMTKRFDREKGNLKNHIQTLCAINHLDYKKKSTNSYEQLFITLRELGMNHSNDVEAFRRMVFNIMGRNCDDHTKNISFILRQGSGWELAPAYDLIFAYNPTGEWTSQHLMSINGKYKDFFKDDLYSIANRFGIGSASRIIDEVENAILSWPQFAKVAGVAKKEVDRIKKLHIIFNRKS